MAYANDPFADYSQGLGDAGDDIFPITPSDSLDLPTAVRAIRANTAGAIVVTMRSGQQRTLNFAAGETRVGRFIRVWATSTTATGIEGYV
jgi:hypothetical protein